MINIKELLEETNKELKDLKKKKKGLTILNNMKKSDREAVIYALENRIKLSNYITKDEHKKSINNHSLFSGIDADGDLIRTLNKE